MVAGGESSSSIEWQRRRICNDATGNEGGDGVLIVVGKGVVTKPKVAVTVAVNRHIESNNNRLRKQRRSNNHSDIGDVG